MDSERDTLLRQLGAFEERNRQLEQRLADRFEHQNRGAIEWERMLIHRRVLAEWLIDNATCPSGKLLRPSIDAGLGGEPFIPCCFTESIGGRRYRLELVSTAYSIIEIPDNG